MSDQLICNFLLQWLAKMSLDLIIGGDRMQLLKWFAVHFVNDFDTSYWHT